MEFDAKEFKKMLKGLNSGDLFHVKGLVIDEFKSRDIEYKFNIEIKMK